MSEPKWTPGPWDEVIALGTVKKNGAKHPAPVDEEIMPGESWLDMRHRTEPERIAKAQEENANLALQKAAPKLYEALASIENDDGRIPEAIWEMRNEALAEARGES